MKHKLELRRRATLIVFSGLVFMGFLGCKDEVASCGCDVATIATLTENKQIEGDIFFHKKLSSDHDYYPNTFRIDVGLRSEDRVGDGKNFYSGLIVCNEEALGKEILALKKTGEKLGVKYAGYLKPACNDNMGTSAAIHTTYRYARIVLTKIKLEKKTPPIHCGCDSKIMKTLTNKEATIYYRKKINFNDHYYTNTFWIIPENCEDCPKRLILCNEAILGDQILKLKQTGEKLKINYSGHLKQVCEGDGTIHPNIARRITLTKIEVK